MGELGGSINYAQDIDVSPEGYVYAAAENPSGYGIICKFDTSGNYLGVVASSSRIQGLAVSPDGYIYFVNQNGNCVRKIKLDGTNVATFGTPYLSNTGGVAVSAAGGYVYVTDITNNRVCVFEDDGNYVGYFGNGYIVGAQGIAVTAEGFIYVASTNQNLVKKFGTDGSYLSSYSASRPRDVAVSPDGTVFVTQTDSNIVRIYNPTGTSLFSLVSTTQKAGGLAISSDGFIYIALENGLTFPIGKYITSKTTYAVQLDQTEEIIEAKTARTRYTYNTYGNIITENQDGDTSIIADDITIHRNFCPNTNLNILNKPASEIVSGANGHKETCYYYDHNTRNNRPPAQGNLTRLEQKVDYSTALNTCYTYDIYGNKLTETDPNGNTTSWEYEQVLHTLPLSKTYPVVGGLELTESYTYDEGMNLSTYIDVNNNTTAYTYDTFNRLISEDKPLGENPGPDIEYEYNDGVLLSSSILRLLTGLVLDIIYGRKNTSMVWAE
jgi:YD repeat-containing protein